MTHFITREHRPKARLKSSYGACGNGPYVYGTSDPRKFLEWSDRDRKYGEKYRGTCLRCEHFVRKTFGEGT